MKIITIALLFCAALCAAQTDDSEQLVTVPKRYVSTEGLNHQASQPAASQWIGVGREIGVATREGLNAVVDTAEKFGSTKVGTFVMVMIAWKIMAKDVLGIVLGIPLLLGGIALWMWAMKRLFFGYRVLAKHDGKVKEYADHAPYKFAGDDSRTAVGVAALIVLVVWIGSMTFAVIF